MKPTIRRALVPTDFGAAAEAALAYAMALVDTCGASLHVLHVLEAIATPEPLELQFDKGSEIERAIEIAAWEELDRLLSDEERKRLRVELALSWGLPGVEILRYANLHSIDLIAMGTHGRGDAKDLLMGSVAEEVVRRAPCPVLAVRLRKTPAVTDAPSESASQLIDRFTRG